MKEKEIKATFHTFWHALGTLLPLFIAFVLSLIFRHLEHIKHFIDEGDFCLFSAAILTPASYILSQFSRDDKRVIRRTPSIYYAISVAIILITSMLFAGVLIKSIFPCLPFDYSIIEILSSVFLIASIYIFYKAQIFQDDFDNPDSKREELNELNTMDTNFDNLP
ncbi:MAG TPA: hypothetical protein VFT78_07590 [Hanamia sp.]|nr:hypothetical protein [Hanamia sp.]